MQQGVAGTREKGIIDTKDGRRDPKQNSMTQSPRWRGYTAAVH